MLDRDKIKTREAFVFDPIDRMEPIPAYRDLLKVWVFIKKDLLVLKGNRFSLILNILSLVMGIASYFFLGKLFGPKGVTALKNYGSQYFPFVLIGISLSNFLLTALNTFSGTLQQERSRGTLSTIVVTPTREHVLFFGLSMWSFILSSLMVIVYLVIGIVFFKMDLSKIDIVSTCIVLFLSVVVFSSLGILSASFIMVFRRGNPITWLFSSVSVLLGGVYYPVTMLPKILQVVSKFIPLTYSLSALRRAIIQGQNILQLKSEILILLVFALILLPLSLVCLRYAERLVKKHGSLLHI